MTRRAALATGATALVAAAGCLGGTRLSHGWNEVNAPTDAALYDVVMTLDGPIAVGEGGVVLGRRGSDWQAITENGPGDASNGLVAADVTDDGNAVWFVGDSGAIGRLNVVSGRVTDYSAPNGKTSSWEGLAVDGRAGRESVFAVNGSGELLPGTYGGGTVSWGQVSKPSGGESVAAIDVHRGTGYIADTGGGVYRTARNGWQTVGIRGAGVSLTDLSVVDKTLVNVTTEEGDIYVYNGHNWLLVTTADSALHAIDRRSGRGLAAGVGGTVLSLESNQWQSQESPTSNTLHGCALGTASYSDVAVGANGVVLELFG
ncbi:hypothetical protein AUR64_02825 [Haloprofundus marisrubri]|uniref:Uncharacterized protein n=1 Tax=Haloprofundus marisrubri TaxID=1514971 RepID=A0A0W1R2F5_9EURY|nr:hypothetical protein [Haloprofundus marisrubri]KTG07648.1 hypothetical protein AUR64_02825 [Haloprofundus marisrubri]